MTERLIDHFPRYAPPLVENTGWRNKANPQPGDWEHVCTSGECPSPGRYFVTAIDGPSFYYMAGPYPTHAEALARVDLARDIADKHDGRAWFMSWGTVRQKDDCDTVGVLNKYNLIDQEWRLEP